jgi:hypothetical protein
LPGFHLSNHETSPPSAKIGDSVRIFLAHAFAHFRL